MRRVAICCEGSVLLTNWGYDGRDVGFWGVYLDVHGGDLLEFVVEI
jgi:hypothetical protein